jgi:soluble lytic murein transglycosylase-like protein
LSAHPERLALRPVLVRWAGAYHVPPDLFEALAWQESGWQNDVVSSAGAVGIGQLLPETVDYINKVLLGTTLKPANLKATVPSDNIRMAAAYLATLLRATGGQACGAVAAYYQGFSALVHRGVLPESQVYVRSVLGLRPRFG